MIVKGGFVHVAFALIKRITIGCLICYCFLRFSQKHLVNNLLKSSTRLYCLSYTQISPSLQLIFSLLFLDNFLIDFQAFMD